MNLPVDIIAAIAAYLQQAMAASLASATGAAQVYGDYAPEVNPDGSPVAPPYAVVTDGPETYTFEAQDPATGHWLHGFADGTAQVIFYAASFAAARALARQAASVLSDSQIDVATGDVLATLTLFGARSDPVLPAQPGIGQPTMYARAVTFQYKQEFGA